MAEKLNIAKRWLGRHSWLVILASWLDDRISYLVAAKLRRCTGGACGPGSRTTPDRDGAG
jgi:hypothetical protein